MTQQRKQEITRYAVVTVDGVDDINQYGDLNFSDTEGNKHKIGNKRSKLFEAIIPGRAVKLGYAVYMNKEYIASIELFDGQPAEPTHSAPQAKSTPVKNESSFSMPPKQEMTADKWAEKDRITRKSIERQTSLNAAVEVSKSLPPDKVTSANIIATAKVFEAYLEGKEVQPAKSRIVEQAKQLGAKSVDEEDLPPF